MITLKELQQQVGEWSHRNFPGNKPHHPLLGMIEENGELNEATTESDEEDAIADILIYAADYASRNALVLREGLEKPSTITCALARLCHFHLKGEQGIRYPNTEILGLKQLALQKVVVGVIDYAGDELGINALGAVEKVWSKVRTRDWKKNPINAASIAAAVEKMTL